jgi:hypothetical protein
MEPGIKGDSRGFPRVSKIILEVTGDTLVFLILFYGSRGYRGYPRVFDIILWIQGLPSCF